MVRLLYVFMGIVLFAAMPCFVYAAQSTADITASKELKDKARLDILGEGAGAASTEDEYVIGHGDMLIVTVYGEGSMSAAEAVGSSRGTGGDGLRGGGGGGVQVRIDGRISLKYIGDVDVVGMTLNQLADYLKILFATVYDEPIITVVLSQSNSQRYTVMGKVAKPGIYYLDYPINLVQVVARSGGFTEWANSEITVVRKDVEKTSDLFKGNTLRFDYDDFLAGKKLEKNILIKSGDILIVH